MADHPDSWSAFATVEELLKHRLAQAVGGWRGAVEAIVPTLAFTMTWLLGHGAQAALLASLVGLGLVGAVRLAQRQSLRTVFPAVVGVGVAWFVVSRSGRAEDVFLPSILWNAAFGSLFLISVLFRWPMLGFVVAAADPEDLAEDPFRWRRHAGIVKVASALTWVVVGLYGVRLAVMVPLYQRGEVAALGISRMLLGWPAYACAVAIMGAILLRGHTPLDEGPPNR
jgi:hypothetical protein